MTITILAGGQSRRMGTDKAVLKFGGMTLLERAARTALATGIPVLVAGRLRPDDWPLPEVDFVPDALPNCGPLGGLQTALRHAACPVLALACDMPLLTPDALRWLSAQAATHSGEHGLEVLNNAQWEPLFSVYTPACLPLIETRLAAGRLSLHGLIESGDFGLADAPDWVAAQLVNINTPEELAELLGG
ncbi:MAG: molybdenum cofactor guanylyltransferase [Armatimonadota bacterium]|nr:molybdenum cofactor guanylyltransferase [Armatimonadota bacterium]